MQHTPAYVHTHKSITSALPIDCNAAIKQELVSYIADCVRLGMANTMPNIMIANKYRVSGYSPSATVRFFGIREPMQLPAAPEPKRTGKSVDATTFKSTIMALALTGKLTIEQPTKDCAIFSHNGREIGVILTVNGVQDKVLYAYE